MTASRSGPSRPWPRRWAPSGRARCRRAISGISIDTPHASRRARRSSRSRRRTATATISSRPRWRRAPALAVVAADQRADMPNDAPLLVVPDVLAGPARARRARRARARTARSIGVTGSVGKTGTKEALRLALSTDGETHASAASYNNHWGVPLSLARCPASARFAVFEMGMNHAGEIEAADAAGAPACRDHHHDRAGASGILRLASKRSPTPRPRSSRASSPAAPPSSIATIAQFARLQRRAKAAGVARVMSFGEHAKADARLIKCRAAAGLLDRARPTSSATT